MRHPDPRAFMRPARDEPFPRGRRSGRHVIESAQAAGPGVPGAPCPEPPEPSAGAEAAPGGLRDPAIGIERRLVRRADMLWDRLRGAAPLPAPELAGRFDQPPFGASAMLVAFPPPAPGGPATGAGALPCAPARILRVGGSLARFGLAPGGWPAAGPGQAQGGEGAPAAALIALAARAVRRGEPALIERDTLLLPGDPARDNDGLGALLMRAVALPFAAAEGTGPLAAVIVSWRQLLSEEEAAELAGELESAMAALHQAAH